MHKISELFATAKIAFAEIVDWKYSLLILSASYFKDGLKTIAHFGTYIHDLSAKLNSIKQKQDDERRKLLDLRTLLRSAPDFDRVEVNIRQRVSSCDRCLNQFMWFAEPDHRQRDWVLIASIARRQKSRHHKIRTLTEEERRQSETCLAKATLPNNRWRFSGHLSCGRIENADPREFVDLPNKASRRRKTWIRLD